MAKLTDFVPDSKLSHLGRAGHAPLRAHNMSVPVKTQSGSATLKVLDMVAIRYGAMIDRIFESAAREDNRKYEPVRFDLDTEIGDSELHISLIEHEPVEHHTRSHGLYCSLETFWIGISNF
jgi:hypothetical protein